MTGKHKNNTILKGKYMNTRQRGLKRRRKNSNRENVFT